MKNNIRAEINLFQRFFNVVGYASKDMESAAREICVFEPSIAKLEEVILVLNPAYLPYKEDVLELIVR